MDPLTPCAAGVESQGHTADLEYGAEGESPTLYSLQGPELQTVNVLGQNTHGRRDQGRQVPLDTVFAAFPWQSWERLRNQLGKCVRPPSLLDSRLPITAAFDSP